MQAEVIVTQEFIDRGIPKSAGACPVKWATQAAVPGDPDVTVVSTWVTLYYPGRECPVRILLPEEETDRIVRYDRAGVMEPHSFTLDIPEPGEGG